jgi:hypothetical protein
MLRAGMHIAKKEITEYLPLPKNVYQVEILDLTSENRPTYDTRLKPENEREFEEVLNFQFTLLAGQDKAEKLRGRNVWANFVPTALFISQKNGKNMLYKIVEASIGRDLTPQEEAEGLTSEKLNKLIGRQLRVGVEVETKNGKTFNKVKDCFAKEVDYPALNDEEKEKARVKNKEEKEVEQTQVVDNGITNDFQIPTEEEPFERINVEQIPF